MRSFTLTKAIELAGPAGCTVEASLVIEFTHQRADPSVNEPEGVTVDLIAITIDGATHDFNGDYADSQLIASCWERVQEHRDQVDAERAEFRGDR